MTFDYGIQKFPFKGEKRYVPFLLHGRTIRYARWGQGMRGLKKADDAQKYARRWKLKADGFFAVQARLERGRREMFMELVGIPDGTEPKPI